MVRLVFGRKWIGLIRLAITLYGLPYTVCKSGIGAPISCSSVKSFRTSQSVTDSTLSLCNTRARTMSSSAELHIKSRCPQYPGSNVKRFSVPDDKVDWSKDWPQYTPVNYTAPSVTKGPSWADPDIGSSFSPRFNALDGAVDRTSFEGTYRVEQDKPLMSQLHSPATANVSIPAEVPLSKALKLYLLQGRNKWLTLHFDPSGEMNISENPRGRTGLADRGLLGLWGPNQAADPIITRWKVDNDGKKVAHLVSKRPVLQFVSIKRKDCGEWAIPGGMVDPGEEISLTLQREFSEEALNSLAATPSEKAEIHGRISQLFNSPGFQVYKGYVDDPRNTDNAWMETVAINFHDDTGNSVNELPLQAGDDAGQVHWVDLDSTFPLYASHAHFLEVVSKERHAHW